MVKAHSTKYKKNVNLNFKKCNTNLLHCNWLSHHHYFLSKAVRVPNCSAAILFALTNRERKVLNIFKKIHVNSKIANNLWLETYSRSKLFKHQVHILRSRLQIITKIELTEKFSKSVSQNTFSNVAQMKYATQEINIFMVNTQI